MEMSKTFYEEHPRYYIILLALLAASVVTTIVFGYFSTTEVKLGERIIRISSANGQMENSDIAMNPAGDAIIVWQDKSSQGYDIFAQYFDNEGDPIGMPFIVNQYRLDDQKYPQLAVDGEGNFVIVWQSYKQDGNGSGIYGQRFLPNGKKIGSEFRINTYIPGNQSDPAISMNGQGNFVVVWESERTDNNIKNKSIYGQRFYANGDKMGEEFRVNQTINAIQDNPDVSMDDNNNFIVVWQSAKDTDVDIYGRKFDWNKKITTDPDILINKTRDFDQQAPVITMVGSNKFLVVWQTMSQHELLDKTMLENINGQMLKTDGKKSGNEIKITTPFFGHQESPDLIQISPSKLFVIWQGYDKSSEIESWRIYGQILTANGSVSGNPLAINPTTEEWNQKPSISSDGDGNVGITWTSVKQDKQLVNFTRGEKG